jgi:hypothetical protein
VHAARQDRVSGLARVGRTSSLLTPAERAAVSELATRHKYLRGAVLIYQREPC